MSRMVRVSIHPIDGSIAQSLIERLLMFDVTLCFNSTDAENIRQRHGTLLEAGIASINESEEAEYKFEFFQELNTITINESCSIVLHDVLASVPHCGLMRGHHAKQWNMIH